MTVLVRIPVDVMEGTALDDEIGSHDLQTLNDLKDKLNRRLATA